MSVKRSIGGELLDNRLLLKASPVIGCIIMLFVGIFYGWFQAPLIPLASGSQFSRANNLSKEIDIMIRTSKSNDKMRYDEASINKILQSSGISNSVSDLSQLTPYLFGREYARSFTNTVKKTTGKQSQQIVEFPVFSMSGLVIDSNVITMYASFEGQYKSFFFKREGANWIMTTPIDGFGAKDIKITKNSFSFVLFLLADTTQETRYSFNKNGMGRLMEQKQ